jgi:hypothetical protein
MKKNDMEDNDNGTSAEKKEKILESKQIPLS